MSIPEVEGYVVVLQPDAPQILLSGTAHFARPAVDFEANEGVPLFPDLQVTCSISHQVEAKKDESWQGTGKRDGVGVEKVGCWGVTSFCSDGPKAMLSIAAETSGTP